MAEQPGLGAGAGGPPRKEKKKKGQRKEDEEGFPLSSTQMLVAAGVFVLLIGMRAGYDDGSAKAKDDDLLDGQDLYDVMEVAKSASDREVKKAYHKLAMKWHPDKNAGCEDCQVKFQRVARAYEVLSDPMKRKIYDKEQKMMEKSIRSECTILTHTLTMHTHACTILHIPTPYLHSIRSESVLVTSANYKELVVPGSLWFIQVHLA
jgi:hypothetical protein